VTKQKDGETRGIWTFRLQSIDLGRKNRRGKAISSAVAVASSSAAFIELFNDRLTEREEKAVDVLLAVVEQTQRTENKEDDIDQLNMSISVSQSLWREALKAKGWPSESRSDISRDASRDNDTTFRQAWKRLLKSLEDKGVIRVEGDIVHLLKG